MMTYAIATFFAVAGMASLLVIVAALRSAAPKVALLRRNLAITPTSLAVTARIIETVSVCNDGKVVRLPVRARILPQQGLRDAA